MGEELLIGFSYKEVAEALVLHQGLQEGIWGVYLEFGIGAANVGSGPDDITPTAIIPVVKIGLQRFPELNALSVDAAEINPRGTVKTKAAEQSQGKKRA